MLAMINYVKDLGSITKEGYAYKESRLLKSWKKRWTVLTDGNIYTFKDKQRYVSPTEVISLHKTVSIRVEEDEKKKMSNVVKVQTKDNAFYFSFNSPSEAQEWVQLMSKNMAKTCLQECEDLED